MFIDPITCLEVKDPTHAVYVGTRKEYMKYVLENAEEDYMASDLFAHHVDSIAKRLPNVD